MLTRIQGWLVQLALLSMVAITVVDVIGRYLFNSPLSGAYELTQLHMTVLIFIGLPMVTARNAHVKIDFLRPLLGARARFVQDCVVGVISALVLAVLAWKMAELGLRFASHGDGTIFANIPFAPFAFIDAVLVACAAICALVVPFRNRAQPTTPPKTKDLA